MLRLLTSVLVALSLGFSAGARAEAIYGLTTSNTLVGFTSTTPADVSPPLAIGGLLPGEEVVAIDFRPATPGVLVGLTLNPSTRLGRVIEIDLVTGAATEINSNLALFSNDAFNFGIDFDPIANALRIVNTNDFNLRVTMGGAGTLNTDTPLNPSGQIIDAIAYSNNFAGALSSTLYGLSLAPEPDLLVTIGGVNGVPSPNTGTIFTVGPMLPANPSFLGNNGFDISGLSGTAYASFRPGFSAADTLFTINLANGATTSLGAIGVTPGTLRDISVYNLRQVPEPGSLLLLSIAGAILGVVLRR